MDIYNFPNHTKGDTFTSRDINLGFDIDRQLKCNSNYQVRFNLLLVGVR
jgi:hypothetical protein